VVKEVIHQHYVSSFELENETTCEIAALPKPERTLLEPVVEMDSQAAAKSEVSLVEILINQRAEPSARRIRSTTSPPPQPPPLTKLPPSPYMPYVNTNILFRQGFYAQSFRHFYDENDVGRHVEPEYEEHVTVPIQVNPVPVPEPPVLTLKTPDWDWTRVDVEASVDIIITHHHRANILPLQPVVKLKQHEVAMVDSQPLHQVEPLETGLCLTVICKSTF
jgi:hypothetical protein